MKKKLKKLLQVLAVLVMAASAFVWWSNTQIENSAEHSVSDNLEKLPAVKTGLVLGTSKTLRNGAPNYYFENRIEAAVQLYKAGKVKYLIVSGDNSQKNYNEPEDMMQALVARGIPKNAIFLDYAGLRTLDSVVRAKEIFGQQELIIVSQKFHNERAVFIAQKMGMKAFGFNAKDVNLYAGFKTNVREKFARAKVFLDLLLGIKPKFDGPKIVIPA